MHQLAEDRGAMPPSFVIEFAALLGLGPVAALIVTGGGVLIRRQRLRGVPAIVATIAAAYVHHAFGGTVGQFSWPFQGLPIGAALLAYVVVKVMVMAVLIPFVTRHRIDRAWPATLLREGPMYFVGAALAAGIVELVAQRNWAIVPVAIVPLFFAYRRYTDHLNRIAEEHRRLEVVEQLEDGMAVVDRNGQVSLWSDALERFLGCSREAVLGRPLGTAVLALGKTTLPREVAETLSDGRPRTSRVAVPAKGAVRTLDVKLVPVEGGVTLLWRDVTERMLAEQALKQDAERFARAGAGAKDGL